MSNFSALIDLFNKNNGVKSIIKAFRDNNTSSLFIDQVFGSSISFIVSSVFQKLHNPIIMVFNDQQDAANTYKDLVQIIGKAHTLYFPESYSVPYKIEASQNINILMRNEVLNTVNENNNPFIIISYAKAIGEKVVSKKMFDHSVIKLKKGIIYNYTDLLDLLEKHDFKRVDFVTQLGEFSIRGSIIDIFSFNHEYPVRLQYEEDTIRSIRLFDNLTQESISTLDEVSLLPSFTQNIEQTTAIYQAIQSPNHSLWIEDVNVIKDSIKTLYRKAEESYSQTHKNIRFSKPEHLYLSEQAFSKDLEKTTHLVEFGSLSKSKNATKITFNQAPQISFNKNFSLLIEHLVKYAQKQYSIKFFTKNLKESTRLEEIIQAEAPDTLVINTIHHAIYKGFIDHKQKLICYTYHELFGRHHHYRVKKRFQSSQLAITIKELNALSPGDYITHIDHGVGQFSGLQKIENNGVVQEVIRIEYANKDLLYVNIHALHKISKFSGKEGTIPTVHKIGSEKWKKAKSKAKNQIKQIAFDLIKLYAKRKASKGFAFSPDSYLQHELEASFIYEDTPDQEKTTKDVKQDMESSAPMDRLVCGDVGFGKTEIAIRAAFKAVADNKQVAILVPTTILALQHYKTFIKRLDAFPCKVEYLNRFKSKKEQKEIINHLSQGHIDIIIGTHRVIGKDVVFKDLGLLIVDEEHKFGVGVKDKLKTLKHNLDTLTLTATPIPRTLQFSLMGARDLSNIVTPPPNRQPISTYQTEFNEVTIRDAIAEELEQGGQVFFINNKIEQNKTFAGTLQRLLPDARIKTANGQMNGNELEQVMMNFIEGEFDILISTTIVESGLDIPNANTIFINDAHHFGLSDLHQMRGRVGRSNKKAACYLITPPRSVLNEKQRKRISTLVQFSDLGSGFNIALQDLDIRGCGNLLGGEQSGFINDIGIETYQKILKNTINELKHTDFKALFKDQQDVYTSECIIETDLETYIPSNYIASSKERLAVYKTISQLKEPHEIQTFQKNLTDRFGTLPKSIYTLSEVEKIRLLGCHLGFKNIKYIKQTLIIGFIEDNNHEYFNSDIFKHILEVIASNTLYAFKLNPKPSGVQLIVNHLKNLEQVYNCLTLFNPKFATKTPTT